MVLMKKLYLFSLNASLNRPTSVLRYINKSPIDVSTLNTRKFSTKKSNDGNNIRHKTKTKTNKFIDAQNDFVTHQLNTSFAAHLKRQQKLWNQVQKEEKEEEEKRKWLKQNSYKVRDVNYGHKNENWRENRTISDESSSNEFHRKSNYHKNPTDTDHDDISNESDSDDYDIEKLEIPNWDDIKLNEMNKDVYRPSDTTQNRHAQEVDAFRNKMQIKIDANAPKPIFEFNELNGLTEMLIAALEKQHIVECTPIQSQGIPLALSGANMLAISQSG